MSYKEPPELLTIQQACRLINVHPNTLRNWERKGKLSALRIGSRHDRRYRLAELLALLSSNSRDSRDMPLSAFAPDQAKASDFRQLKPETMFALIARYCISLSQAAELTGYHEDYLGQTARLGELRAVKIGRNWITLRSSLEEFCRAHAGAYPHKRPKMKRSSRAGFPTMSSSP
jgi:excisionase family DNA binding protein